MSNLDSSDSFRSTNKRPSLLHCPVVYPFLRHCSSVFIDINLLSQRFWAIVVANSSSMPKTLTSSQPKQALAMGYFYLFYIHFAAF
jgi:hypothetical protein